MPPKPSTNDSADSLKALHDLLTTMQAHMEAQDQCDQFLQQTMESRHDTFQAALESLKKLGFHLTLFPPPPPPLHPLPPPPPPPPPPIVTLAPSSWYKWIYHNSQFTTWESFTIALETRFGPSSYENTKLKFSNVANMGLFQTIKPT